MRLSRRAQAGLKSRLYEENPASTKRTPPLRREPRLYENSDGGIGGGETACSFLRKISAPNRPPIIPKSVPATSMKKNPASSPRPIDAALDRPSRDDAP